MVKMLDVKPFQETLHADMCGPASLKMVFDYYGIDKTEDEVRLMTWFVPGIGIGSEDIIKASESLGFKTTLKNEASFEDIQHWLDKKVPVIVDWFTRGRSDYPDSEVPDGHYSIVIGLDNEYIYLQDPEIGGIRKIKRDDFMRVWFDFPENVINRNELIIRQMIAVYR